MNFQISSWRNVWIHSTRHFCPICLARYLMWDNHFLPRWSDSTAGQFYWCWPCGGTRLEKKESPHEEQNDPENGLTYPMKHSPTLQQTSPLSNKNNDPTIKWPTPRRTGRSYEEIEKPPRPRVTHPTRNHTTLPRIVQTTQQKRLPTLRRTTVDYVPNVVLKILKTLTPLHPN